MSEPFLGEVILFAGTFAPRSWAFCEGQLLAINSNQALFSILGTTYGGDGRTTFALPDLRGRVPIGAGSGPGRTSRSLGARGGTEGEVLTTAQIPGHTHAGETSGLTVSLRGHTTNNADQNVPAPGNVLGKLENFMSVVSVNAYSDSEANLTTIAGPRLSATVENAGGSQSHENRQPLIAINYIIALQGIFPSRS